MFIGFYNILDHRLDHLEIKQDLVRYEWEKPRPTVENDSGSWTLFTGSEVNHLSFKKINHSLRYDEREKPRPTVENHSGSRPLFTELEVTHLTFKKIDNC